MTIILDTRRRFCAAYTTINIQYGDEEIHKNTCAPGERIKYVYNII